MGGSNTAATTIRLVIQSRIRLVDLVHNTAEQMAQIAGFDSDACLNVGIAVREAVINAITHGNKLDPSRDVDITLEAGDDGIKACVCDQGGGFDPHNPEDPTTEGNLLEDHGRGLLLIRAFVDDVDFRYREGRGMEITLVKRIDPGERGNGDAQAD